MHFSYSFSGEEMTYILLETSPPVSKYLTLLHSLISLNIVIKGNAINTIILSKCQFASELHRLSF